MKTQFRVYTHDRPAKFTYSFATLTLSKNEEFQLAKHEGRTVVIKDGTRFPVKSELVPELVNRSELRKPAKDYAARVQNFDALGRKVLKYIEPKVKALAPANTEVLAGYRNNMVYAGFEFRTDAGAVQFFLTIRENGLSVGIYSPLRFESPPKKVADMYSKFIELVKRVRGHLTKEGYEIGRFDALTSKVGNLRAPDGKPFSGTIYSYGARIKLQ